MSRHVRFDVVEAYHIFDDDDGAACNAHPYHCLFNNYISLSRKTDPWLTTPQEAINRAAELQWICMSEKVTQSLSVEANMYLQPGPPKGDDSTHGPGPTIPCHPHVNDRWCDDLDGSFISPINPLSHRLLDERNSASVSAEPAEHTHIEGQEHHGDPEDEQLVIIDGWQELLDIHSIT